MDKSYKEIVAASKRKDFNEDNDCTVISMSVVCGMPYAEAHAILAKAGRKPRKGFSRFKVHNEIRQLGFTITEIPSAKVESWQVPSFIHQFESKTVRTLERELAQHYGGCKILIYVAGHVAGWNGKEIVDWSAGRQQRIQSMYLVYKDEMPLLGKSVPVPERKPLKKTGCKRSAVRARCPELGIYEFVEYRSVKAAYEAMGLDLQYHQRNRLQLKHFGKLRFTASVANDYWHRVDVYMELVKSVTDEV